MSQLKRYNGTSWEIVGGVPQEDTLPINAVVEYDGSTVPDGYELVENIISDGSAVKTGRYIDGKEEYVKRFYWSSVPDTSTSSKSLGFALSSVTITNVEGIITSNSANVFPIPFGNIDGGNTYAVRLWLSASDNKINLQTYNANFRSGKAFANVYYIENN